MIDNNKYTYKEPQKTPIIIEKTNSVISLDDISKQITDLKIFIELNFDKKYNLIDKKIDTFVENTSDQFKLINEKNNEIKNIIVELDNKLSMYDIEDE